MSKGNGWEVTASLDKFARNAKAIDFMRNNEVYIGIQQDETTRKGEPVTNAELLFIHTNGSPARNIPARPVIEPAIEDDGDRLSQMMKKAAQHVFAGEEEQALAQLKKTGMRGQNVSRAWFTNDKNGWPPNAPSVAEEKRKKGATDPRPLIDTGELRKSITYFVKTKGGREK